MARPEITGRKGGVVDPPERKAFTVREFCDAYRVSHSHAYKLMSLGKLRSVLVGGRRLIPVEAAQALLNWGAQ